jgi:hypothetical protein
MVTTAELIGGDGDTSVTSNVVFRILPANTEYCGDNRG